MREARLKAAKEEKEDLEERAKKKEKEMAEKVKAEQAKPQVEKEAKIKEDVEKAQIAKALQEARIKAEKAVQEAKERAQKEKEMAEKVKAEQEAKAQVEKEAKIKEDLEKASKAAKLKEEREKVEKELSEFRLPITESEFASLDSDRVISVLKCLQIEKYAQVFRDNAVTGQTLLILNEEELKSDLEIKAIGDRKKLISYLKGLKSGGFADSITHLEKSATTKQVDVASKPTMAQFDGRFGISDSESTEYKGILDFSAVIPNKSCKDDLLASVHIVKTVPMLNILISDCEQIVARTIMQREEALNLVFFLFPIFFF